MADNNRGSILEKMTDELQFYINKDIFSKEEEIVKERRNIEYKL